MSKLRIHYFQHVEFEDLANIRVWAEERDAVITHTRFCLDESLPSLSDFDWLVIMGGPMSVHDEKEYPWLPQEKQFIREAILDKKIVLGFCLGAQLIAEVLGSRVYRNRYKEIGWFPLQMMPHSKQSKFFSSFPDTFMGFHWHGDTFDLPQGALHIASSRACLNQAFEYEEKVFGLQFHWEINDNSIRDWLKENGVESGPGPYIQTPEQLLGRETYSAEIRKYLYLFLDRLSGTAAGTEDMKNN